MYFDKDTHSKYHIMDMDYEQLISVAKAIIENKGEDIGLRTKTLAEIKWLQEDANKKKL